MEAKMSHLKEEEEGSRDKRDCKCEELSTVSGLVRLMRAFTFAVIAHLAETFFQHFQ